MQNQNQLKQKIRNRIQKIQTRLNSQYGDPESYPLRNKLDPLTELIATVLSQHTSDKNSNRAFEQLVKRYPKWEEVRKAPLSQLAGTIKSGGLGKIKALRIKTILNKLSDTYGKLELSFLSKFSTEKARSFLESLPGVGPKTASCVLLFSLNKPVIPVDTHVYRVSKRLGLIGKSVDPRKAQNILESLIESPNRYAFHVGLIKHGRETCKSQNPKCNRCILLDFCPSGEYY